MSQELKILVTGILNQNSTTSEINKAIKDIEQKVKKINLVAKIDIDSNALKSISDFTKQFKKIEEQAKNTGKIIEEHINPDGSKVKRTFFDGYDGRFSQMSKEAKKAGKEIQDSLDKVGNSTNNSMSGYQKTVKQLREGFKQLSKEAEKFNHLNDKVSGKINAQNASGTRKISINTDPSGNVKSYTIVQDEAKKNKLLEQVANERQRILEKINKVKSNGYGSNKDIKLFESKSQSNDINKLKQLSKEIDVYSNKLGEFKKKANLSNEIKSIETLVKNGSVKLPKGSILDDLKNGLNTSKTTKELDEVANKVKRLKDTLSGREKLYLRVEQLKADNILPSSEIAKVKERIRKAQTPEQVKSVSGNVSQLESQKRAAQEELKLIDQMARAREQANARRLAEEKKLAENQAKAINKNAEQERKATENLNASKDKLRQRLQQLSQEGKVSAENLKKLNSAIDNSKNNKQIQNLEANLKNLNRIRENEHKLEMARQQAQINAQRINTTHGSHVDTVGLQQYLASVNQLTPRTANLNQEIQKTRGNFDQLSQGAKSAAGSAQKAGESFSHMFSTALQKFPIWMISATA